jgi:hypothetical protein
MRIILSTALVAAAVGVAGCSSSSDEPPASGLQIVQVPPASGTATPGAAKPDDDMAPHPFQPTPAVTGNVRPIGAVGVFDCDVWCDRAGRKCPELFGPDSGLGECTTRCAADLQVAGACAEPYEDFLRCSMSDPGFGCDIAVAQRGGACSRELASFDACSAQHPSTGSTGMMR